MRRLGWGRVRDTCTPPPPPPLPASGPHLGEGLRRSDKVFSRQLRLSSFDWAGSARDHLGTNLGAPQRSAVIGSGLFCYSTLPAESHPLHLAPFHRLPV